MGKRRRYYVSFFMSILEIFRLGRRRLFRDFRNPKNDYCEICEALKRGKEVVDCEVENAFR